MIDEEECAFRGKPEGRTWERFDNRSRGNTPWKPNTGPSDGKTLPSQTKPRSKDNTSNPRSTPYGSRTGSEVKKSSEPCQHRVKLSMEEHDRLRAEGLCFNCRKPGYESRNCPDRHLAKPPSVIANAISLTDLDCLAHYVDRVNGIELNALSVGTLNEESAYDRYWSTAQPEEVCDYLKALWLSQYLGLPETHFEVTEYGSRRFNIYDRQETRFTFLVNQDELIHLDFCIQNVIQRQLDDWHYQDVEEERRAFGFQMDIPDSEYPA
ncbi:hypothetical protein L218DRAFT_1005469 [Marasmius fiardii PR-910]|nr:hypothetical protein L218DRAFT_1005469 [Marasmius fiardii PR-910]